MVQEDKSMQVLSLALLLHCSAIEQKTAGTQLPDQGGQLTDHFRGNKDFWRCPTFLTLPQQSTFPHLPHFAV